MATTTIPSPTSRPGVLNKGSGCMRRARHVCVIGQPCSFPGSGPRTTELSRLHKCSPSDHRTRPNGSTNGYRDPLPANRTRYKVRGLTSHHQWNRMAEVVGPRKAVAQVPPYHEAISPRLVTVITPIVFLILRKDILASPRGWVVRCPDVARLDEGHTHSRKSESVDTRAISRLVKRY